ncbi:hypothetical protein OKW21_000307 [Catalinimonas alkaloidigena]|uniref:putative phage abortive infection protein n=1 Tax=Catalinimonas alkaloidigena TaxID=1075417 RepID=UPI0024065366|nr:putative phage abortive infection protein [Catalinimonas alkaloidigena]MDF9795044.1 hypothetical protein [Catalinimonas alkaloidigena]
MEIKLNKKTGKVEFNENAKEYKWSKVVKEINSVMAKSLKGLLVYYFIAFMLAMFAIIGVTIFIYYKQGLIDFEGEIDNETISGFGTFLGGFVGTIFSGVAVFLVFLTYLSQKEELRLTRQEMESQNETLIKQNYENVFFKLLDTYGEISRNVIFREGAASYSGKEVFKLANESLKDRIEATWHFNQEKYRLINQNTAWKRVMDEVIDNFIRDHSETFTDYINTIFEILKYIKKLESIYPTEYKFYRNIFISQITTHELVILFYYSLAINHGYKNFLAIADHYNIFDKITDLDLHNHVKDRTLYAYLVPLARMQV